MEGCYVEENPASIPYSSILTTFVMTNTDFHLLQHYWLRKYKFVIITENAYQSQIKLSRILLVSVCA